MGMSGWALRTFVGDVMNICDAIRQKQDFLLGRTLSTARKQVPSGLPSSFTCEAYTWHLFAQRSVPADLTDEEP